MTTLLGILGAAVLFVLFGFAATRQGSRLEAGGHGCGDSCELDSCSLSNGCEGRSEDTKAAAWWPDGK